MQPVEMLEDKERAIRLLHNEIAVTESMKNRYYSTQFIFFSLSVASLVPIFTLSGWGQILSIVLLVYGIGMTFDYSWRIGYVDSFEVNLRSVMTEITLSEDCRWSDADIMQLIASMATSRRELYKVIVRNWASKGKPSKVGWPKCPHCGKIVPNEWRACGYCGIMFNEGNSTIPMTMDEEIVKKRG